jgi:hypothetical protein
VGIGCSTVVVPPSRPADPEPVFLLDHGRHASLVLPGAEGGIVRYAYGDWRWYAEGNTGLWQGAAALFWPTRAGLGRREMEGPVGVGAVRRQVRVPIEVLYELMVEARAVAGLRMRLDSIYEENLATRLTSRLYDLEFVEHPNNYWALHNSNVVVASWLRELGVRVEGAALFSDWQVSEPATRPAPP